ncbi:MBL fold metallo-hydrolase [Marinobacterium arenosum]|uniref:MBL fold metallo-hydrolase n=1 Tax=Marinobacterium arenosum TaxID=2862496 RepID=UPI001C957799|nr:MBL fold metallo-hydrolase [Marinobacterium arenosum]MBY4677468.1 MBL fold metallo-hydrolase [Marinobacterium arenosum]
MIFEQFRAGGCLSYLIGCEQQCVAILVDPEVSLVDRYLASVGRHGLQLRYLLDTHTHADHFSASHTLSRKLDLPVIMHRKSPTPFVQIQVDDGESIIVGDLRLKVLYTPGHTADSICLQLEDRVLTGDTLLIGSTGRTDLPTGDPAQLYDSLFNTLLKLPPATRVYPAHDYHAQEHSTLAYELANNPRLQVKDREAFIAQMNNLNMKAPTHLTEALRINCSGGDSIDQLIAEAADRISFMSIDEVYRRVSGGDDSLLVLDVRERDAFEKSHIPGATHIPRGQLELRVDGALPDPTQRILVYCEQGKISTLATAMMRRIGYGRAVALDGGFQQWRLAGYPVEKGSPPSAATPAGEGN